MQRHQHRWDHQANMIKINQNEEEEMAKCSKNVNNLKSITFFSKRTLKFSVFLVCIALVSIN